jgi:hypothetical protein
MTPRLSVTDTVALTAENRGATVRGTPLSSEEKIEALTDLICRAGDEPSAALLVLLSTLENSTHSKALTNTAKHFAFTRCNELNLYGMIDAQIAVLEGKLLEGNATMP